MTHTEKEAISFSELPQAATLSHIYKDPTYQKLAIGLFCKRDIQPQPSFKL